MASVWFGGLCGLVGRSLIPHYSHYFAAKSVLLIQWSCFCDACLCWFLSQGRVTSSAKRPVSSVYRKFVATWDHIPDNLAYSGQATLPKDLECDLHKVPELEK